MQQLIIKRQADLVTAAYRALTTQLREDEQFARRYPTLNLEPYRMEPTAVGLRVATRRTSSDTEDNWDNIRAILLLDQGVVPPGSSRRTLALWKAHEVLATELIPTLIPILPNITRGDLVKLLHDAWPASRGRHANPMFDARLVKAASQALAREHPSWGARAIYADLATCLNVSVRTIANLIRKK